MSPSRPFVILVVLLSLAVGAGAVQPASAESELEEARRLAEEAEQALDAADRRLEGRIDVATSIDQQLQFTLDGYRRTNAALEQLGLRVAQVRYEMDLLRADIRTLDRDAQARAADAYMRSVGGDGGAFLLSDSYAMFATLGHSLDQLSDRDFEVFDELDAKRSTLLELQGELAADQRALAVLDAQLEQQKLDLEVLFTQVSAEVAEAYRTLAEVDAAYQAAQANLEEVERKYVWTGSVQQWRSLVEAHFPPDRVDEAMRVMACESGGNPNAKNPNSTATGLFQFLDATWAWTSVMAGYSGHSRLDPEANVATAAWLVGYSIRTNHPWGAWGHWECQP